MTNNQLSAGQPLPAVVRRPDWRAFRNGLPLALAFASFLYSLACVLSQGRLPTDLGQTALRALLLGACWWAVLPLLWRATLNYTAQSYAAQSHAGQSHAGQTWAGQTCAPDSAAEGEPGGRAGNGTTYRRSALHRAGPLLVATALALLLAASSEWLLHRGFGIRAADADHYGLLADWLRHLHRRLPLALAITAGLLWWRQRSGRSVLESDDTARQAPTGKREAAGSATEAAPVRQAPQVMAALPVMAAAPVTAAANAAEAGAFSTGDATESDADCAKQGWTLNTLLPAMTGTGRCPVPLARVMVLKAAQNYVELQLTDGRQLLLRSTLRELLARLPAEHFRQVHRSWVVRLDAIDSVLPRRHVRLHGGQTVPLGRLYEAALRAPVSDIDAPVVRRRVLALPNRAVAPAGTAAE